MQEKKNNKRTFNKKYSFCIFVKKRIQQNIFIFKFNLTAKFRKQIISILSNNYYNIYLWLENV